MGGEATTITDDMGSREVCPRVQCYTNRGVMRDQLLAPQSGAHRRGAYIYFRPLPSNPSTFEHLCLYNVRTKAFKHCDYKFKIVTLRILLSESTFAGHSELQNVTDISV